MTKINSQNRLMAPEFNKKQIIFDGLILGNDFLRAKNIKTKYLHAAIID